MRYTSGSPWPSMPWPQPRSLRLVEWIWSRCSGVGYSPGGRPAMCRGGVVQDVRLFRMSGSVVLLPWWWYLVWGTRDGRSLSRYPYYTVLDTPAYHLGVSFRHRVSGPHRPHPGHLPSSPGRSRLPGVSFSPGSFVSSGRDGITALGPMMPGPLAWWRTLTSERRGALAECLGR